MPEAGEGTNTYVLTDADKAAFAASRGWVYDPASGTYKDSSGVTQSVTDEMVQEYVGANNLGNGGAGGGTGSIEDTAGYKIGTAAYPIVNAFDSVMSGMSKNINDNSGLTQSINEGFTTTANKIGDMLPPPYGQIVKAGTAATNFAGDAMTALGLKTDQATKLDQVMDSNIVKDLTGGLNDINTRKLNKISYDQGVRERRGSSYMGSNQRIDDLSDLSGARVGTLDNVSRLNSKLQSAQQMVDTMTQIDKEAKDREDAVSSMSDVYAKSYNTRLNGGLSPSAFTVGEKGGKIETKEKRHMTEQGEQVWPLPPEAEPECDVEVVIESGPFMPEIIGMGPQKCVERPFVPDVMDYVPEIIGMARHVARKVADDVVDEVIEEFVPYLIGVREPGLCFNPDIADFFPEVVEFDEPVSGLKGIAPDMEYDMECDMEPESIEEFVQRLFDMIADQVDGMIPEREACPTYGMGRGMSWTSGMSRTETTRNVPGIGPVTMVEERRMKPQVHEFNMGMFKKGGNMEKIEKQLDAPDVEESDQMNLIPEGSLHKNRHHMSNADEYTKKGIPVVDLTGSGEQEAEIEKNEIIFNKEVTNKLEELYYIYYSPDATAEERDAAAVECGKLLTREIMLNTDDRTGLINELKRGGRMQDGGELEEKRARMQQDMKPPYKVWVKDVNPDALNDNYDLERAYDVLPYERMERWKQAVNSVTGTDDEPDGDPEDWHLQTVYYDKDKDKYVFLKKGRTMKENPELQGEFEWYGSDPDFSNEYKMVFDKKDNRWNYIRRRNK